MKTLRFIFAALSAVRLFFPFSASGEAPPFDQLLQAMEHRFEAISDYRCVYRSFTANEKTSAELIFTYFFKKPKRIRMEVLNGKHPGTVMLYDEEQKRSKVRLAVDKAWVAALQKMLGKEYLDVDDGWVTDLRGNGIHESDWGWFIDEHLRLLPLGKGQYVREDVVNGRETLVYVMHSTRPPKTRFVKKETIWVDRETLFPIKYVHHDSSGKVIRRALFRDVQFDLGLKKEIFYKVDSGGAK